MTQPKMIRCEGSRQEVYGPDEPTGTVQFFSCGNSILPMKATVVEGKKQFSVPEHKRRLNPFRPKGVKKNLRPRPRGGRRDSGKR